MKLSIPAVSLSLVLTIPGCCHAFVKGQPKTVMRIFLRESNARSEEPDLLDYFDPLRSPHDYPDGIDPNYKPIDRYTQSNNVPKYPAGLHLFANDFPSAFTGALPPLETATTTQESDIDDKLKFATSTSTTSNYEDDEEQVDILDIFDPTLSPHAYPNGIPSTASKKKFAQKVVGILLIDHGSKNEAANHRLHDLARLYQEFLAQQEPEQSSSTVKTTFIVKAAHMEIASPSIPEVLESFVNMGSESGQQQVDEIICHPYFLSPGRHATQDIPQIIQSAKDQLEISIPVITTSPVGAMTDLMITAIHSVVTQSSNLLQQE
jgi:CbiX